MVVPPTLAMQWEKEIRERSTRQQNVIVVDDLKQRRHFLTSVGGMRACAPPIRCVHRSSRKGKGDEGTGSRGLRFALSSQGVH